MNEPILAQNSICANSNDDEDQVLTQWQIDHDAYAESIAEFKEARQELEKALGVEKDFDKTCHSAKEIIDDLRKNGHLYALINRFEEAVINRLRAKDKL
ncbi:TPA: hypothetical protein JIE40_001902 [Acinetobacter baumannii]|uniref:hypothetical protein n=1 Tax=Acinetobacter baumannii TaxID=470 RepID=UPI001651DA10|nr:hypothetical protein [Acinetobacter baumannii]EKT7957587.1 hypothetical protein [Acinetobacter baumannii]MBC6791485.1 hypothetical protein [Acinetobacter baumannii]MDI2694934.1 hypothetical protein [Acinetobacter baumannii]HAV3588545.1 hypothetical protein [Acinetobacter baumannii]HCW3712175.1 hypothetical protein [Acinetobacter baumannii]